MVAYDRKMSKTVKEAVVEEVAGEAVRLLFNKYDTDADGRLQKKEFMRVARGDFLNVDLDSFR